MRNKLVDLNNHLFEQMERLNDEDLKGEKLNAEIKRSLAMAKVANSITKNNAIHLSAAKLALEHHREFEIPDVMQIENKKS